MSDLARCVSPIDGVEYCSRPLTGKEDALAIVEKARAAQAEWAKTPLTNRVRIIRRGCDLLCATTAEAVPELARMMGRPVRYGGEFTGVHERVNCMADIAADALSPLVIEDSDCFSRRIIREPPGVVGIIAPWNYPYLTAINCVAPALIAGAAVILKPATQTLLSGERMRKAFIAGGVPADVFHCVFLSRQTALALISAKAFDYVNFTGSVAGGREIERAAAGAFIGVGLELGGKDAAYVMEDADVWQAAAALVDAAMFNSGQCCCGIERVYVAAALFDDFVAAATELARAYVLGDPLDKATTLGPMASSRFAAAARAQIAEAATGGATLHIPAFAADDGGAYLSPQVLTGVNHKMRIMREETFAPVVGIMPVRDDDAAIALMNDSDYGLTASLWTADEDRAARLGARLAVGTIFMNRADYLDPALCWAGRKDSGRGASLSALAYHHLTRPKSYHLRKRLS